MVRKFSFGHLAQIVCTSLAENEWYKKSFAWLARPRQARFRNRQSPIGTEIWIGTKWLSVLSPLTEWIQSCILLSVIEVWIVFTIQSIHDNSWYPYSAYKNIYCVIVKAYYNCHSYEGMSNLWRYVILKKVCQTCKSMSYLTRYVKLVMVYYTLKEDMSNLWRYVILMEVWIVSW